LANGDRIKVFPRETFVTVLGAVNEAGRYEYNPGSGVMEYIALAGGNSEEADMGGIQVVRGKWRPGGAFEVAASFEVNADAYAAGRQTDVPPILPGDVIYVPLRDVLAKRDIASILTSFTISALALFK
jgi:protein involved in polysaccharide export with SLBB domain